MAPLPFLYHQHATYDDDDGSNNADDGDASNDNDRRGEK